MIVSPSIPLELFLLFSQVHLKSIILKTAFLENYGFLKKYDIQAENKTGNKTMNHKTMHAFQNFEHTFFCRKLVYVKAKNDCLKS